MRPEDGVELKMEVNMTSEVEKKGTNSRHAQVKPPFHTGLKVWMDGEIVPWQEATVHVMAHVLHYGSSVFEGVRCYKTSSGPAIFRLQDHVRRLFDSARIYRMDMSWTQEEFSEAMKATVRANGFDQCYIRPLVYRGLGTAGVNPAGSPVCASIVCWDWGHYLGSVSVSEGVDTCVSSWTRMAPNTMPALAKASSNYMNGQLIKLEAVRNGFAEGIALDPQGYVSEGSGENIFLVRDGIVRTPPLSASVLPGITRDTVMTLLKEMGIEVVVENLPREALYIADELFFTGTATEVAPIRSVDHLAVGDGKPGPITLKVQQAFQDVVQGRTPDPHGWLAFVS